MEFGICSCCIEEPYLKSIIKANGTRRRCSECCEDKSRTWSIAKLGEEVAKVLVRKLRRADGPENGDDLEYHIQDLLGQSFDFQRDLTRAVEQADDSEPPFLDNSNEYVESMSWVLGPMYPSEGDNWVGLCEELKYRHRFFSEGARQLFSEWFAGIDALYSFNPKSRKLKKIVHSIPKGKRFYRARTFSNTEALTKAWSNPFGEIGPPPPYTGKAGRMNAEGIRIFYGATDARTCLAEMRPAIGAETAVIQVETTTKLRILDFTRIKGCGGPDLSVFDPIYWKEEERFALLRRLGTLISKPIVPGQESDYLITQTMSEYLSHVHSEPFDGFLFNSVQRQKGVNIVLFAKEIATDDGPSTMFPVRYVKDSVRLYETKNISYKHYKTEMQILDGELFDVGPMGGRIEEID